MGSCSYFVSFAQWPDFFSRRRIRWRCIGTSTKYAAECDSKHGFVSCEWCVVVFRKARILSLHKISARSDTEWLGMSPRWEPRQPPREELFKFERFTRPQLWCISFRRRRVGSLLVPGTSVRSRWFLVASQRKATLLWLQLKNDLGMSPKGKN